MRPFQKRRHNPHREGFWLGAAIGFLLIIGMFAIGIVAHSDKQDQHPDYPQFPYDIHVDTR